MCMPVAQRSVHTARAPRGSRRGPAWRKTPTDSPALFRTKGVHLSTRGPVPPPEGTGLEATWKVWPNTLAWRAGVLGPSEGVWAGGPQRGARGPAPSEGHLVRTPPFSALSFPGSLSDPELLRVPTANTKSTLRPARRPSEPKLRNAVRQKAPPGPCSGRHPPDTGN